MATETAEETKRGNPNFGKRNPGTKWDAKKRYQFKLMQEQSSAKPRDAKTGELADNPYPPIYIALNSGVGYNKERKEMENWRYVFGYNSIWVKDQDKPEPSKAQLDNPKNHIIFNNGNLFVQGNNVALLEALSIQDCFEGNDTPVSPIPKIFELVNEDKVRQKVRDDADVAYLAEKAARESKLYEIVPVAMMFGIDVDDPEENEDRIRTEVIMKAKAMPAEFSRQFVNPKNQYKYNITMALRENLISATARPGKMILVDTGEEFFNVKEEEDAADQFASMLMYDDKKAKLLYNQVERLIIAGAAS